MEYIFTKFEKTNARLEKRISITAYRSFGFPTKFFIDNKIGKYKYVVLFYDAKNKAVGFQFTNDEAEKHKFTLIRSKEGYGGAVVATSFFKSYNMNSNRLKGKYEWKRKNIPGIGQLFVINLTDREVIKKET